MTFRIASGEDTAIVKDIIHTTILNIYPKYYPSGVVDFFINYHSEERILNGIENGIVLLLEDNGEIIGTGNLKENEISAMYIYPQFQGKGYGTSLINELERIVKEKNYSGTKLESSLAAFDLYLELGYLPKHYHKIHTNDGSILCYFEMEKIFKALIICNN